MHRTAAGCANVALLCHTPGFQAYAQFRQQFLEFYKFLDEIRMSPVELSLRFVISNPDISCVLMGAKPREEVEQNVAVVEKGPLSEEIQKRLDEIAAMVPFRPYDEDMTVPLGYGIKYLSPEAARRRRHL